MTSTFFSDHEHKESRQASFCSDKPTLVAMDMPIGDSNGSNCQPIDATEADVLDCQTILCDVSFPIADNLSRLEASQMMYPIRCPLFRLYLKRQSVCVAERVHVDGRQSTT